MVLHNLSRFRSKDGTANMVRILCKQRKGINICHINGQSLSNKIDELRFVFENSNIDLICVSETWFTSEVSDLQISLNGYSVIRTDRDGHAGGVAIYIKNGVQYKKLYNSNTGDKVEYVFAEVKSENRKLLVGTVYRPNRRITTESFLSIVENLTVEYDDAIIAGDFNCNILEDFSLAESMISVGFTPINTTIPTHFTNTSSTLLDIFFVSNYSNVLLYDQLSAPCFSKHDLIFICYDFELNTPNQIITFRDFKSIDYNLLQSEINQIDWSYLYNMVSVDEQMLFFEQNICTIFDTVVPLKTKLISHKTRPWFSNSIKSAIYQRDQAYARWKRFKTTEFHNDYRAARNKTNKIIKNAKSNYYSTKFSNAIGSKRTWQTIREVGIGKSHNDISLVIDADNVNEKFVNIPMVEADLNFYNNLEFPTGNEFNFSYFTQLEVFSSCLAIKSNAIGADNIHPQFLRLILSQVLTHITYIFNNIVTSSCYPSCWKRAKIIPIPKSNSDYRPIAILPFLSKVFEKIIHNQMTFYLNSNNMITNRQSGFRKKHSCITALADVIEDIRMELDEKKVTFLVLLDHSKAFDTVDHNLMCFKLRNIFNFSNTSTRLMSSYLSGRFQYVHTNTSTSKCLSVKRGVPQGSIIGPLLFTLYANDLPKQLNQFKVRMYADDVQLYISCDVKSVGKCIETINQELQIINIWASSNGLSINPQKSKCIVIKKRSTLINEIPNIFLNNKKIQIVESAKNLGIVINNELTWNSHINYACGRTYSMLRSLWRTQHCTPPKIRMLLVKTYLMPTLLYGCELFASCDSLSKNKLNVLFNNIVRYVYALRRYDPSSSTTISISPFSTQIYGIPFGDMLKSRVLCFLHKIIYTQEPDHLFNRLRFSRSNRGKMINTIQHRSLMSEWQFYVYAVRLWNSLPHKTQLISNAKIFQKNIVISFSNIVD